MSYSTFHTKLEDEIAILTISRPESLNALNSLFFQEIPGAYLGLPQT